MFNIDDIVKYGINGVCKIVTIEEKNLMGTKKNYLVLKPLNGDKSTFYVPIALSEKDVMSNIFTRIDKNRDLQNKNINN